MDDPGIDLYQLPVLADGLPGTLLLRDERDVPRYYEVLPMLNDRACRRLLARKSHSRVRATGMAAEVIENDLRSLKLRQAVFWSAVRKKRVSHGDARSVVSLELALLLDATEFLGVGRFDEAVLAAECSEWPVIRQLLEGEAQRPLENVDPGALKFLMCWPGLQEAMSKWDGVSPAFWSEFEAVFALSSISGSPWFLNEALRRCPAAWTWLEEMLDEADLAAGEAAGLPDDEAPARVEPRSDAAAGTSGVPQAETDWKALGAALQEIATRLVQLPCAQWAKDAGEMSATLEEAFSALKLVDPSRALREQLAETQAQIADRLAGFAGQEAFAEVLPEMRSRLAAWQDLGAAGTAAELARIDAALRPVLEGLEPLAQQLSQAHAARETARLQHEEAQRKAEASPSRATKLIAADLRASDAAAEGALVRAQVAFLELIPDALQGEGALSLQEAAAAAAPLPFTAPDAASPAVAAPAPPREAPAPAVHGDTAAAAQTHGGGESAPAGVAAPVVSSEGMPADLQQAVEAPPARATDPPAAFPQEVAPQGAAPIPAVPPAAEAPGPTVEPGAGEAAPQAAAPARVPQETVSARDVWQALRRNQRACAYQLARLCEIDGLTLPGAPPASLLRATVLADELLLPDGAIAAEINAAFAALDLEAVTGPAEAVAATHLILAAALLRPLLLAPDSIAPQLAGRVHLADGCGEMYSLLQAFAEATGALRYHRLGARAFATLRDEEAWSRELAQQEEAIRDWRRRAPTFSIKYAPATALWREWLKGGGEIDRLLGPIAGNDPGAAAAVRAQLARLEEDFPRLVHESDRKSKRRGDEIHGAALGQLRAQVQEATGLAQGWLLLIDTRPAHDGPRMRELDRARAALATHRMRAVPELEALARSPDERIAAAALIAGRSLAQVWALFEPQASLPAAERNPRHLLNRPLLTLPECTLQEDWSIRGPVRPVREALAARGAAEPGLEQSFETRIARHDILGAARIAEMAALEQREGQQQGQREGQPEAAAQMRARLEQVSREYWAYQRRELAQLGEQIESSIVYGLLGSAQGDAYSARLLQLEQRLDDLTGAEHIEAQIAAIRGELGELAARRRQEIQDSLRALRGTADPADIEIIDQSLKADDLPSATEYLTRLRDGQRLQDEAGARDPFAELHGGTLARDIEGFLNGEGRNPLALSQHIERGNPIGALDLSDVPEAQRKDAVRLLQAWYQLKKSVPEPLNSGEHNRIKSLQQLLTGLGFTNVRGPQGKSGHNDVLEADFTCDPVAERAICPVPYFGSSAQGRYRLLCVSDRTSIDQLLSRVGPTVNIRPTVVLYFGRLTDRQRRELAAETRAKRRCFIVVDEVLLVFLSGERGSRLPALFACALPYASFDPYVTTSSFVPPELFFGRHNELDRLLDPMGACFVYGGRQLGKTALLKHAERSFHAPAKQHYAAWIDLRGAGIGLAAESDSTHVWRPIWRRMVDMGLLPESVAEPRPTIKNRVEPFLAALESWLASHPEGRVLLLLDEADRFLEDDARHSYRSTAQLKRLMEGSDRRFKVAFAGLHNVLRTAEQANHPLGHFGEPIEIGPLIKRSEWREARQLVHGPLLAAGFQLERAGMADRMLAQTNFYPSLIQLYCSKVIARMMEDQRVFQGGPRFLIKEARLDETFLSRDLRDEIRQKFRLTLQLDPRYAVIAYAIAYRSYEHGAQAGTFTATELADMARNWWPEGFERTAGPEFRIILDEMVGLGVLRRAGDDGPFTLRNPNLLLLMGTQEEVGDELMKSRDLPEVFAPQEFHSSLSGPGAIAGHHPLTITQIGALGARRSGVAILAGAPAAAIDRVTEALRKEHGEVDFVYLQRVNEQRSFLQELRYRLAARAGDGTTLLLVPQDCPWSRPWVEGALSEVGRIPAGKRGVKVVFSADAAADVSTELPDLAALPEVEVVTLRPWTDSFVRHWSEERGGADGPAEREALRGRTGFWPLLLERPQEAREPPSLALFVGRHARLGGLLRLLADLGGDEELKDIAELSGESPEAVRRELTLGQLLGVVTPAERDGWRLEPGLAALFRNGGLSA